MSGGAMLYEDYILIRDAKAGETVTLSDGTQIVIGEKHGNIGSFKRNKTTKNVGLDYYDRTYNG